MKNLTTSLAALCFLLVVSSCTSGPRETMIGKWKLDQSALPEGLRPSTFEGIDHVLRIEEGVYWKLTETGEFESFTFMARNESDDTITLTFTGGPAKGENVTVRFDGPNRMTLGAQGHLGKFVRVR